MPLTIKKAPMAYKSNVTGGYVDVDMIGGGLAEIATAEDIQGMIDEYNMKMVVKMYYKIISGESCYESEDSADDIISAYMNGANVTFEFQLRNATRSALPGLYSKEYIPITSIYMSDGNTDVYIGCSQKLRVYNGKLVTYTEK